MNGDSERNETLRHEPSLLQFRLSTLLLVVAVCSGLFATMILVGAVWSAIFLFVIAMVGAHVAGNAIGTRLRAKGSSHPRPSIPATSIQYVVDADPPRLRNRSPLDRLTFIFIAAGALAGVLIGKRCFSIVDHGQFTSSDWSLGIASFAVIGGLFAFLATSFLRVGFGPAALSIIGYFSRAVHRERR